ncbi:hypothetical protein [Pontibacter pamirensis]|uniref:hypothetical protein n=1 Tax=Pontibacter pamirensis TaxID=2562824 RepID=UPI00138A4652|nr:hypothetical protein [Pontibacter pamirensis]
MYARPTTLPQAIAEIQAMPHKGLQCAVVAIPYDEEEAKPRKLMPQQDFDAETVSREVEKAFTYYAGHDVLLKVYARRGFRRDGPRYEIQTTFQLINDTENMSGLSKNQSNYSYPQPSPQPEGNGGGYQYPSDMGQTGMFIMSMKDEQLRHERGRNTELRDQVKILETTVKDLIAKNQELQMDVRFKDKEHEITLAGIEQNSKKGFSAIVDVLQNMKPEVLGMLMSVAMPGRVAMPQLPMGGVPMPSNLTQNQQEAITEINSLLSDMGEEMLTKLYAVALYAKQGNINLDNILAQINGAA